MMALLLFACVCVLLMFGFPVAITLAGASLWFALIGAFTGTFDATLGFVPGRLFGVMTNTTLIAVPLFVFMGVMLERSKVAENLLDTMAALFGPMRGGLGISVVVVGMLLAASTGIVGATVVTMGLLSLPTMLRRGYDPGLAAGTICASGTLGQIIPPSIILILLGDVISNAYSEAQLAQAAARRAAGNFEYVPPDTVSVGDLFTGALLPGLILVAMYVMYLLAVAAFKPQAAPAIPLADRRAMGSGGLMKRALLVLVPPLLLIVAVLGSIIAGIAAPTEAASIGAVGAMLLAVAQRQFNLEVLRDVMRRTVEITSMVFLIFIGAAVFSLVFRGFGGDELVTDFLSNLPGGTFTAVLLVMLVMFLLGFVLDFIEITLVVVPIVGPVLLAMGLDPIWLGVMIAINLQTSFLTPPFGFSLFYLRGVAPAELQTSQIYRGVIPFIVLQLIMLTILALWPQLATWLPEVVYPG